MSHGFLSRLFGRGAPDPTPDFKGPLGILPGDAVEYYQRRLVVTGIVLLAEGNERRHQYHLADEDGRGVVLVAESDPELVLSLQEPLPRDADPPVIGLTAATWAARAFARTHEGTALSLSVGDVPPEKLGTVETLEFEDGEEMLLLVQEQWGDHCELRAGEYVHESELVVHRQGDDEYVARPPPAVDLKSMNEARRARTATRVAPMILDAAGQANLRRIEKLRTPEPDDEEIEVGPDQASRS